MILIVAFGGSDGSAAGGGANYRDPTKMNDLCGKRKSQDTGEIFCLQKM